MQREREEERGEDAVHARIVQSVIDAQPKRRVNLWGCVLALLLVCAGVWWSFPYLWWGRGAHAAPEELRAASTLYAYDAVIEVQQDRVVFRRSRWEPLRTGLVTGFAGAIAILALRRGRSARWWMLFGGLAIGTVAYVVVQRRHAVVTIPRGAPGRVLVQQEGELSDDETHFDIVLADGARTTRLVRLPWNAGREAQAWRALIEEKLRR